MSRTQDDTPSQNNTPDRQFADDWRESPTPVFSPSELTPTAKNDSKWSEILSDKRYADVILVCRYNVYKIPTYRCLLAKYSNVFEELLKESTELPVTIKTDFDSVIIEAAAFMLDKPFQTDGNEVDIFKFAVKYEIHEKQIDYSNVCEFIQIAYTQKIEKLKKHCLKFLV
uniref:BTB domain-containing protein n=1 Tax=Panagrolaimus sp. ES5 TaxID=591445 RepID=A0AC34G753_9BILA